MALTALFFHCFFGRVFTASMPLKSVLTSSLLVDGAQIAQVPNYVHQMFSHI